MNGNSLSERLEIEKFIVLKKTYFDVKPFNIITGDIASGKSLLMKLVEFFGTTLTDLFVLPYRDFLKNLSYDKFCKNLAKELGDRFNLNDDESFEVCYKCQFKENVLDIKAFREEGSRDISVESNFLKNELQEWENHLKELEKKRPENSDNITDNVMNNIDAQMEVKFALYEQLSHKFDRCYPVSSTFVPASRAALAFSKRKRSSSKKEEYYDYYMNEFNNLAEYLKRIKKSRYEKEIKEILKAEMKINGDIHFVYKDANGVTIREVEIANAASGQQEVAYILLLLSKLFDFKYRYGEQHYIFIEEPEAHLFPREQKRVLELIGNVFSEYYKSKSSPIKIFITTHSPYLLNVANNLLLNGKASKKIEKLPTLDCDKISAVFIDDEGSINNILDDHNMISPNEIEDISRDIFDEYNFLYNLKNKL
ncbi:MAG: ATP-binding protein [Fibromonadales bacterium]|nr:ATP-binding protein [Fibromonadales bacterium]